VSCPPNASVAGVAPPGYRSFDESVTLARRDFDVAAQQLFGGRVHEQAGLHVAASDLPLRLGSVVVMQLGFGPLSLRIPCRVIDVVDEPSRRGFTYATLPGHPESGEERFLLERDDTGAVRFTVAAVSRPATLLARAGGPLTRTTQSWMTRRYLGALDRLG
jgi:uncharacterized protein (UPF0548 family)